MPSISRIILYIYVFGISLYAMAQTEEPPEITAEGDQYYCPLSTIKVVTNFNISGPEDLIIDEFYIQISSGYVNGDRLFLDGNDPVIQSTWDPLTAKLTLSKSGGSLSYQEIIDAVKNLNFQSNDNNFEGEKYFSFTLGNANFLPSTGHFYEYISSPKITWTQARILAEQREYYGLQGYLATVTSREEAQLTGEQADGAGWIGGSDAEVEGTWKWVTGPEAGMVFWKGNFNGNAPNGAFEFWNTGEPNNLDDEDYAHVTAPNIGIRGSWNDLPNQGSTGDYEPKGYLVEYGFGGPEDAPDFSAFSRIFTTGIDSTFSATRCGPGVVQLRAVLSEFDDITSDSEIFWFDTETAGTPIAMGENFAPDLLESTTFYAMASQDGCVSGQRHPVAAVIFEIPDIEKEVTLKNCDQDENPTDGFTDFNLQEANDLIVKNMDVNKGMYGNVSLPPQLFSYYLSVSDAKLEVNALNPFPFNNRTANVVFARVENSNGCFDVAKVNLAVSATEPVDQVILESCDMDETNDGYYTFDLNQATSRILAQLPPQNLRVQYYRSLDEAILEQNEITNSFYKNETPFFQGLFIRVESEDNGDCISLGEFVELYVFELPEFYVPLEVIYCQDKDPVELAVFNPQGDYTYEWKDPSGTVISNQPSVLVESSGTYTVTAVSDLNCVSKIREISVRESSVAQIEQEDISIVDGGQQNSISIDTDQLGMGEYEYALDNPIGPYQQEPFFANVLPGIHTLYIRDQLGCGTTEIKVSVIGYPKFFTPNGDGQNDTWQVEGVSFQPGSIIYIYDKFGKLLAELDGTSEGWNGIYNGKQMPSSDYWYRVQLEDGRIQTGHFSLIGR